MPHKFLTRTLLEAASNPEDLYNDTDLAAQVGGGAVLPGNITDIDVAFDAVFVSVSSDNVQTEKSGIFHSQAIFDDSGKIIGWTKWARAALNASDVAGFSFNPISADFWSIVLNKDPNNNIKNTNTIFRTRWSQADTNLERLISQQFLKEQAGVQGLSEFEYILSGFNKTIGDRVSFLLLTGFSKVGFIESSRDINNILTPTLNKDLSEGSENIAQSENGQIPDLYDTDISNLFISGGALSTIGNITSSAIVCDDKYAWLVVSGSGGIAVLCDTNGAGWPLNPGLSKGFKELSNLSFKVICDYKSVTKIVGDKNNLYVLTDNNLDRLDISSKFIYRAIQPENRYAQNRYAQSKYKEITNIAKTLENNLENVEIFLDMLVSPPLALLATSNGFYRSGNNIDISKTTADNYANWTLVNMPEAAGTIAGHGPATRIFSAAQFQVLDNKFKNIYLLNAYSGYEQGQLYRFALSVEDNKVTDNSVLLFQDIFIKGKPTFFVNLEDYRNYIYSDGATISASRGSFMTESSKIFLLPYNLKSSQRFGARKLVSLDLALDKSKTIGQLIKSSSGSFIVYGDFGIRFNY